MLLKPTNICFLLHKQGWTSAVCKSWNGRSIHRHSLTRSHKADVPCQMQGPRFHPHGNMWWSGHRGRNSSHFRRSCGWAFTQYVRDGKNLLDVKATHKLLQFRTRSRRAELENVFPIKTHAEKCLGLC